MALIVSFLSLSFIFFSSLKQLIVRYSPRNNLRLKRFSLIFNIRESMRFRALAVSGCAEKLQTQKRNKQLGRTHSRALGDQRYRARSPFATISARDDRSARNRNRRGAAAFAAREGGHERVPGGGSSATAISPPRCTRRGIQGRRFGESAMER